MQTHFVLNLEEVTRTSAVLTNLRGDVIRIPIVFIGFRPPLDTRRASLEHSYWGEVLTVKRLGILARRAMGLPGRTPLDTTTRITWGEQTLHVHRPIGTLLPETLEEFRLSNKHCMFCKNQLLHSSTDTVGPYEYCEFCEDSPSWHHEYCCPFNPCSQYNYGLSHTQRFEAFYSSHVLRPGRTAEELRGNS